MNLRKHIYCCCLVAKACPTLYDTMDYSLPGSSVHGIIEASTQVGCHLLLQGIFLTQGMTNKDAEPTWEPLDMLKFKLLNLV